MAVDRPRMPTEKRLRLEVCFYEFERAFFGVVLATRVSVGYISIIANRNVKDDLKFALFGLCTVPSCSR